MRLVAEAGEGDQFAEELGIGGQESAPPSAWALARQAIEQGGSAQSLRLLQSLYNPEGRIAIEIGGRQVRTDTVAGQIFVGLWEDLRPMLASDREAFLRLCVAAEDVLGIPASQLAGLAGTSEFQRFRDGLFTLFARAGYDVTYRGQGRDLPATIEYREGVVRIHVNPSTEKAMSHLRVNLLHPDMNVSMAPNIAPASTPGKLFVDVPLSALGDGGRLKVILWWQGEDDATTSFTTLPVDWQKVADARATLPTSSAIADLSTLPEGDTNRAAENLVLSQLAGRPPISFEEGSWFVELGSDYHDHDSFHALDLNLAGASDRDKELLAVAHGTISRLDLTHGTLVIDHDAWGDVPVWQSVYLHLPLYETGEVTQGGKKIYVVQKQDGSVYPGLTLWEGKEVNPGDAVGIIAGRGPRAGGTNVDEDGATISDTAFPSHLHYEAHVNGRAINMARLVKDREAGWNLPVYASDEREHRIDVTFTDAVTTPGMRGAWVNTTHQVIYSRDAEAEDEAFLAWENGVPLEQMQRVVWQIIGIDPVTAK